MLIIHITVSKLLLDEKLIFWYFVKSKSKILVLSQNVMIKCKNTLFKNLTRGLRVAY